MNHLLFIIYFITCIWLVGRISYFKNSGVPTVYLRWYFAAKVAVSVFYGWFYQQSGGGDTWAFHQYGLDEWSKLRTDPLLFFTDIFQSGYNNYGGFFSVENSWWNDLDANVMAKLLAVFNLLTGGSYFVNTVLFNLLTFAGPLLIYKTAKAALPNARPWVYYLPLLIPSVLFWCSGIHKEGLLLLALGLVVWSFHLAIKERFSIQRILGLSLGLLIMLVLRNYLLLPLFMALLVWAFAQYTKARLNVVFVSAVVLTVILFFGLRFIHPSLNLPKIVAQRQEAFRALGGKSAVTVKPLEPTVSSFVQGAPAAARLAFTRPWPTDVHNIYVGAASAETVFIFLLSVVGFLLLLKHRLQSAYWLFCALFSVLLLLIIGYSVPIVGAVVRYRCLALPWLLLPATFLIDATLKPIRLR